jgi:hypothetical protein
MEPACVKIANFTCHLLARRGNAVWVVLAVAAAFASRKDREALYWDRLFPDSGLAQRLAL